MIEFACSRTEFSTVQLSMDDVMELHETLIEEGQCDGSESPTDVVQTAVALGYDEFTRWETFATTATVEEI